MPKAKTRRKVTLSRKKAFSAARKARKYYGGRPAKKSRAWKKGGKQWSRVLGHFGATA